MAQSTTNRTPLGIDPYWDKPTPDPPFRWEKWRVQYKLYILNYIFKPIINTTQSRIANHS